jgi:hypothetical protein
MNRREILRYTALITGGAVSASFTGAFLAGCSKSSPDPKMATSAQNVADLPILHFFTPEQFLSVTLLADTILPRTDSPSATDVKAHHMIDAMLGQVFNENYTGSFKNGWLALQRYLDQHNFTQQEHEQQVERLLALELAEDAALAPARKVLVEFKQMLIAYYLSTEEIGEKFLNYLPIPVTYQPCISVNDVNNKAWAI